MLNRVGVIEERADKSTQTTTSGVLRYGGTDVPQCTDEVGLMSRFSGALDKIIHEEDFMSVAN